MIRFGCVGVTLHSAQQLRFTNCDGRGRLVSPLPLRRRLTLTTPWPCADDVRRTIRDGHVWQPDLRRHPLLNYSAAVPQTADSALGKQVVAPTHTMRVGVSVGEGFGV